MFTENHKINSREQLELMTWQKIATELNRFVEDTACVPSKILCTPDFAAGLGGDEVACMTVGGMRLEIVDSRHFDGIEFCLVDEG